MQDFAVRTSRNTGQRHRSERGFFGSLPVFLVYRIFSPLLGTHLAQLTSGIRQSLSHHTLLRLPNEMLAYLS